MLARYRNAHLAETHLQDKYSTFVLNECDTVDGNDSVLTIVKGKRYEELLSQAHQRET
jgi:hypothetical protein